MKIQTGKAKKGSNNDELENLLNQRKQVKKDHNTEVEIKNKHILEDELNKVDDKISKICASNNTDLIKEHLKNMCDIEGNL